MASREQRQEARESAVAAVQQAPEIRGFDLDDGLQDLEAIKQVVNQLQPSPLGLTDLEAILTQPELLPPGKIGPRDFAWTQPGSASPVIPLTTTTTARIVSYGLPAAPCSHCSGPWSWREAMGGPIPVRISCRLWVWLSGTQNRTRGSIQATSTSTATVTATTRAATTTTTP